ncbi:MAG: phosphotransferase [Patescibacteria group bacterium]|jgi:aminoglycoside phosphotransferase
MRPIDFLLDKNQAEKFFTQNSQKIFEKEGAVEILEIKRSETYNPDSFNIFYRLRVEGVEMAVRGSASIEASEETEFKALQWCYEHGLNSGNILAPKPLGYFEEYNLMFYENVSGNFLLESLGESFEELAIKVTFCAQALRKFHSLPKPNFHLWNASALFHCNEYEKRHLERYFPKFGRKVNTVLEVIKSEVDQKTSASLCHGDFQPTNIIINQEKFYILDYGLTSFLDKEYDLVNFINQLRVMLKRFGRFENFEKLKETFLSNYGPSDPEKFQLYNLLSNIRILTTFSLTNLKMGGADQEYMDLVYQLIKKDIEPLEKIRLKINES